MDPVTEKSSLKEKPRSKGARLLAPAGNANEKTARPEASIHFIKSVRQPLFPMNPWQAGVMKLLGKVDPRIWKILFVLASTSDTLGRSGVGRAQLQHHTGWSAFKCQRWLDRGKQAGWWNETTSYEPVETFANNQIRTRKVVSKILDKDVRRGKVVPGNTFYPHTSATSTAVALLSVARDKLYRPIWRENQKMIDLVRLRERKKSPAWRG